MNDNRSCLSMLGYVLALTGFGTGSILVYADRPLLVLVLGLLFVVVGVALIIFSRETIQENKRRNFFYSDVIDFHDVDREQPIGLYLRSFEMDKHFSKVQSSFSSTQSTAIAGYVSLEIESIEEQLIRSLGTNHPIIALDDPQKEKTAIGAKRIKPFESDWQEKIIEIFQKSNFIIISAGMSGGLWWEINYIIKNIPLQKVAILIPLGSTYLSAEDFINKLETESGIKFPIKQKLKHKKTNYLILYFDAYETPQVNKVSVRASLKYHNNRMPLYPAFRIGFKKFFQVNRMNWTPPVITIGRRIGNFFLMVFAFIFIVFFLLLVLFIFDKKEEDKFMDKELKEYLLEMKRQRNEEMDKLLKESNDSTIINLMKELETY